MASRFGDRAEPAVQSRFAGRAAKVDDVGDPAVQFLSGFNEQLASVIDAPQQAGQAVLEALGQGISAATGADRIPGLSPPQTTVPTIGGFVREKTVAAEPKTAAERVARRAGRTLEESLMLAVPTLAAGRAALAAPSVVKSGAGTAQTVLDDIVSAAARSPGAAISGEAASGIGAGAAGGIAAELGAGQQGQAFAELAGGIAPVAAGVTPVGLAVRAGRGAARRLSPQASRNEARRVIGEGLGTELEQAQSNLDRAQQLREAIPGFDPALGQAAGTPSLEVTQQFLQGRMRGEELDTAIRRHRASLAAIDQFALDSAPGTDLPLVDIIDAARKRPAATVARIGVQEQASREGAEGVAERIAETDSAATGVQIREGIEDLRQQAKGRIEKLKTDLGLDQADSLVDFSQFKADIQRNISATSELADRQNIPRALTDVVDASDQQPFSALLEYRSRLTDDLRDEMSSKAPSAKKARLLRRSLAELDEFIEDEALELGEAARIFRKAYFDEIVAPFKQGAVFKVRRKTSAGDFLVEDEKVFQTFFRPGNISAARQFRDTFTGRPEEIAAFNAAALDNLRDFAITDGVLNEKLVRRWIKKHETVLNEFPELKGQVGDIDTAVSNIAARQRILASRRQFIEDQSLNKKLESVGTAARPPSAVIQSALADPRVMRQLVNRLRSEPEALNGLKRHIWGVGQSGDVGRYVRDNEASLKIVLGEGHVNNLKRIAEARAIMGRVPEAKGQPLTSRPGATLEEATGITIPGVASRIYAVEAGRSGWRYQTTELLGRVLRGLSQTEAERLLKEALYNPQVAKDLAIASGGKIKAPLAIKRLGTWALLVGGDEEAPPE